MQVDNSSVLRLFGGGQAGKSRDTLAANAEVTALLNRQASMRRGIVEAELPGNYRPVYAEDVERTREDVYATRDVTRAEDLYEEREITETRDLYETRDVYATRDVFETRDITERRDLFELRDVYEARDVFAERDITESRDITETRDIFETRAVYENRAVMGTAVEGNRSLSSFNTLAQADIDVGADFAIRVGDGAAATIRFSRSDRISVTVNGSTQNFGFSASAGSMRQALLSALNSVDGLDAAYTSDGRLSLATESAQRLQIADVANGLLDFSRSPLAKLGLATGTTQATVQGYEQVQVGTEQVRIGSESIVTGTQQVVVGTERYVAGSEQVLVGQENVRVGSETYVVGQEQVRTGTEQVKTGTEQVLVGTEAAVVGMERIKVGVRTTTIGTEQVKIGTRVSERLAGLTLVGLEEATDRGVGASTLLERLSREGLPHGYLEALFAGLPTEEEAGEDDTSSEKFGAERTGAPQQASET